MASAAELLVISLLAAVLCGQIEARASPYELTRYEQGRSDPDFVRESGTGHGIGKAEEEDDAKPERFHSYSYNTAAAATTSASKTPQFSAEYNSRSYQDPEFEPVSTKNQGSDPAVYKTRSYGTAHDLATQTENQYPTGGSRRTGKPIYRVRGSDGENRVSETGSTSHGMSDTRSFANGAFFYDLQGDNHGAAYTFHSRNQASQNQVKPAKNYFTEEWDDDQQP